MKLEKGDDDLITYCHRTVLSGNECPEKKNLTEFSETLRRLSVSVCKLFYIFIFIQVCSNEWPRPFPRGDNYEIAKIH